MNAAWDQLFKYFNWTHNKGWIGYQSEEQIVIKLNTTNLGAGGHSLFDWMNSTPELVLAILENLIDTIGVNQADITIGDPYRGFPDEYYDICHPKYPDVHYVEGKGTGGREQTKLTNNNVFFTSETDDKLKFSSRLPQAYMDAEYLINMPCFKTHDAAGITLAAKNHQGSVIGPNQSSDDQSMVKYLHYAYPDNEENQVMGIYRHIVDYMAHSKLGGNTLVYIVDGIWGGRSWQGYVDKFGMPPFNNDYPNSLFISQDAVAIESVGFDFLYNEYKSYGSYHNNEKYPLWEGVQDYIHQAADAANWPVGIVYDPDNADHSKPFGSLGVHEHWNDVTSKQYSVNLTGEKGGIHLVSVPEGLVASMPIKYKHENYQEPGPGPVEVIGAFAEENISIYPNPVKNQMNIRAAFDNPTSVIIDIISLDGRFVKNIYYTNVVHQVLNESFPVNLSAGQYFCRITTKDGETSIKTIPFSIVN
ncbi:MAG: DUF362 domain-containing protein [Bacteroidales bacterium]|nr:DUF362 domain-containing protein [Bacteroidales bacterium]